MSWLNEGEGSTTNYFFVIFGCVAVGIRTLEVVMFVVGGQLQTSVLSWNDLNYEFLNQTNLLARMYCKRVLMSCFSFFVSCGDCVTAPAAHPNSLMDQHHKRLCNCRIYIDHKKLSNGCRFPCCSGSIWTVTTAALCCQRTCFSVCSSLVTINPS